MDHQLPPLPYLLDALEPHISRETMEFHYGKHHRTYVDKLNELIKGTEYANMALEDIIRKAEGPVFNNAAQTWNHMFFWNSLSPEGGGKPEGALARAIGSTFGSFAGFKDKFSKAATEHFGSGWAWLVRKGSDGLAIETLSDAGTPLTSGAVPLLACDVWEHAYYIDYRNARPDFLKAYWKITNWDFASRNFTDKKIAERAGSNT